MNAGRVLTTLGQLAFSVLEVISNVIVFFPKEISSKVSMFAQASIDKVFMENKYPLTARNSYYTKSEEEP